MNGSSLWRVLAVTLLLLGGAAVVGVGAYNAGVAHGIAESGRALTPGGGPYPLYGPWHWGFGFFPIFPLFFLFFIILFVVRPLLWWRGPWRGGWHHGYGGVPPAFEEWHRRAHAEQKSEKSTPGDTQSA